MTNGHKLHGVEAARGMAAVLVVLVHAGNMLAGPKYLGQVPLGGLFKFGHAGVDFFFVLSGFIILHTHSAAITRAGEWLPYVKKRLLRIYPAYWVVLSIYAVALMVSPTAQRYEQIPDVAVASIFLMPHPLGPVLGPAWSLSHELLFYALFSILFFSRRLGVAVLSVWLLATLAHVVAGKQGGSFWVDGFLFRVFNLHFFIGMTTAWACQRARILQPAACLASGLVLFFGMGLWESLGPGIPSEWVPAHLAYGVGAAFTLYGLVGLERQGSLRVPDSLVYLGAASYSLYLLHVVVIMAWQQVILKMPWILGGPSFLVYWLTVAVAITGGLIFHRFVETWLIAKGRYMFLKSTIKPFGNSYRHGQHR